MSDSCPSSSDKSSGGLQEKPLDATPPRWQQGCYREYSSEACRVADCPYRHDLNPDEVTKFLVWQQQENQHLVFNSQSISNSHTTSKASSHAATNSSNSTSNLSMDDMAQTMTQTLYLADCINRRRPQCSRKVEALIASATRIPPVGPKRQQLVRKLKESFSHIKDEELVKLLPRDNAGRLTSIGSLLHESEECRPCRVMLARQECDKGIRCGFCHYPHDPVPTSLVDMDMGDRRKTVTRPCKAQRDKYRKHVDKIEEQIREDPWSFDPTTVELPASIFDGRPEVKNKFLMRMAALADMAKIEASDAGRPVRPTSRSPYSQAGHAVSAVLNSNGGQSASSHQLGRSASSTQADPSASSHERMPVRGKTRTIVNL